MNFIGTAGWSIPAHYRHLFPMNGSQLERYATLLNAVEINSSFYRSHQRKTYERWANSVPADFRFSVKIPNSITREKGLTNCADLLAKFRDEVSGLGKKLGILLVQLPPSLAFDAHAAEDFFDQMQNVEGRIACEPRHPSWFTPRADAILRGTNVARVAADPPRAATDGVPGGATDVEYWRLHGSPKIYYSNYDDLTLRNLSRTVSKHAWCIFDNTAAFHALGNALRLIEMTRERA